MHFDDAFDFLVERLAAVPNVSGRAGTAARNQTYGHDIWLPTIVTAYWQLRIERFSVMELEDESYQPFYDATWELCRIVTKLHGAGEPLRERALHQHASRRYAKSVQRGGPNVTCRDERLLHAGNEPLPMLSEAKGTPCL